MKLLIEYLKPLKMKMLNVVTLKSVGAVLELLLPYLLAHVIDKIVPLKDIKMIIYFGLLMIMMALASWRLNVVANRKASDVAKQATQNIRHDLFKKTLHLSSRNVDRFTIPSLETRLTTDTYNVHRMIGMIQRMGIRAPILLMGGIVITFIMEPYLSTVMMFTLPFIGVLVYVKATKGIPFYSIVQKAQDKMISVVRENAQGVRIIKALSKFDDEEERYQKVNKNLADKEKEATLRMAIINPMMNLFMNLGLVGVILVGAMRVNTGLSETGKIIGFTNYFTLITNAMMAISRIFIMLSKGIASADRIQEVMDVEDEFVIQEDDCKESEGVIEFNDVSFSYLGVQDNLSDISFTLHKGETLGIIGPTGSGKSTMIQLLLRFYDVDEGVIRVYGKDIRSMDPKLLRRMFGTVLQNDFIFQGTIQENIAFGRELQEEALIEGYHHAQAEFIDQLEDGLNHALNSKGVNLSGGQRQRVYLSRAFAGHPEILLLDDSSSALDYATDARLRKAIDENFKDCTKIIVAQRVSSIMHADEILVLEEGRIIGRGNHESLMENCPLYASISESQMGGALLD